MDMIGMRHRLQWRHFALLAVVALLVLAPFDITLARLCYSDPPPRLVVRALELIEDVGGSGTGALLLVLAAVIIGQKKWTRLPQLLSASLGAGLVADIAKLCIHRSRPHSIDLSTATFGSTIHGFFPALSAGSTGQSFPSGHTATAAGLAVALTFMYPRGRWFFAALAATVAVSRVIVHAHFPTDVVAGALLGVAWGLACYSNFSAPAFAWSERVLENAFARISRSGRTEAAKPNNRNAA
jgi:membrane-associated phospholipid phosphatase